MRITTGQNVKERQRQREGEGEKKWGWVRRAAVKQRHPRTWVGITP